MVLREKIRVSGQTLFIAWFIFTLFIYLAAFIMELLYVNIADPILWLADRCKRQGSGHKIGRR
jgi:hypothetical protein